ncbi:MAG: acyl-CoA dehydrogenase family protein [Weizmannia coagulans]|jgi:alkylation response protein AidB-like acyl-CoA dehydrogenase|uniref:acyl-CoA dehydrogenase family protein n=1 Tax=Heyndrickxia TaxID=2837504 RepID=UPI00054CE857|nr:MULTISPECIES: acyl-CoA dehydrogenase family protein [Heyndrickxia]MCI1576518.1 acyl-CoA dehydrogenase family protein [Heyndrickxia coagulans]NWN93920.1 acyl-CoA dehydrogenase family protein [Bacillus sp. (in: firmicutes)]KGT39552.1 acyl-CoA dehydrogenase [Heyndrickxia coagulans P38]MBQ4911270.1 acyl-CoA dehydrogenase family protein [Heyndrickxia faecalis]MED4319982.1 acyl-CoA dehydrogenase family protein [Weizmannia sp. CD-2023]
MDFELSKEQIMLQEMVRDFAEKEIEPYAREVDETGKMRMETFQKLGNLGLLGIPFPEKYGGAGGDTISYCIAVEEIGKACGGTGLSYAANTSLGASPIYYFGTEEQKQKWLVPMAKGEALGAFGLTEPNAGSDAGGTRTKAVLDGDEWVISGEKCWITNAEYARQVIVTAVTGKRENGRNIISAIIVPADAPGVAITSPYEKMGVRGSNTCQIVLENVRVPRENLLGDENKGFSQFLYTLDGGRISIAALSVGIAQAAFEKALRYAKERMQFGQAISKFQAIQFKLADMAMEIDLARNAVYKAAWLKDQGKPFSKEAAYAKLFASEMGFRVCNQAIQIHGGSGYMREYDVERHLRDIKLMEIGEGTSEIQRLVIARKLGC